LKKKALLRFQQIANHLLSEGTVPVPPRAAPVLCDCVVLPSLELSLQRGCHSGGGGGIKWRSPKGALRKILWAFRQSRKKAVYLQLIELFFPVMKNQEITEL